MVIVTALRTPVNPAQDTKSRSVLPQSGLVSQDKRAGEPRFIDLFCGAGGLALGYLSPVEFEKVSTVS
jgi:hypothetical protein